MNELPAIGFIYQFLVSCFVCTSCKYIARKCLIPGNIKPCYLFDKKNKDKTITTISDYHIPQVEK